LPRSMPTNANSLMMMASKKTPCESVTLAGCGGDHLITIDQDGGLWSQADER
jgi:hypothetical protein